MPQVKHFIEVGRVLTALVDVRKNKFVEDLFNELVEKTPVCTGYARASWYATPGIPKTKNDIKPKKVKGCTVVYPKAKLNLSKYKKKWTYWYITNLAPYAQKLEEGHSAQAPANWIKDTVAKHIIEANS